MDASTFAVAVGAAKKYTNSAITALGNGFNYKGSKTNYEDLSAIVSPKLGDFWTYTNYAGHEVNGEAVWDGTRWQKLGEEAFPIIAEDCNIWELATGVYISRGNVVCGTDKTIDDGLFNTTVFGGEAALYSYLNGDGDFIYGYVVLENNIIVEEQQNKVETLTHKVSIVNSASNDYTYPTAKAVYDAIQAALYVDSEVTV